MLHETGVYVSLAIKTFSEWPTGAKIIKFHNLCLFLEYRIQVFNMNKPASSILLKSSHNFETTNIQTGKKEK